MDRLRGAKVPQVPGQVGGFRISLPVAGRALAGSRHVARDPAHSSGVVQGSGAVAGVAGIP